MILSIILPFLLDCIIFLLIPQLLITGTVVWQFYEKRVPAGACVPGSAELPPSRLVARGA